MVWPEWQVQSGSGKRGQLRFLVTPESLRNYDGTGTGNRKAADVLELAERPQVSCALLQPFMGGQRKAIHPRCVFAPSPARTATTRLFARPADSISPGRDFRPHPLRQ
ncbi:hypothetical protein ACNKHX_02385 [Shigella flexneri]